MVGFQEESMPISYRKLHGFQRRATEVHCQGDIALYTFGPDENTHGVAWLLLQEGLVGEPGRPVPARDALDLRDQEGVLIAADDVRSLDSIIEALTDLRDALFHLQTRSAAPCQTETKTRDGANGSST
jgi:hypothetical protein